VKLPFKIDCDALTDEDWRDIAGLVASNMSFSDVYGIPRGGIKLAEALTPYCVNKGYPTLIVDDVMTTGNSMLEARKKFTGTIGFVLFDRSNYNNDWIYSLFKVNKYFDHV